MVKYAINTDKKFMTFTSLEPVFVHYTKNYDPTQPGEKDNMFLYEQYPHLKERKKMTGWETATTYALEVEKLIRNECNDAVNTFVTWNVISKERKKHIEKQLDKHLADKQELKRLWTLYKLITGVELGRY
jgi:hypothetical protein